MILTDYKDSTAVTLEERKRNIFMMEKLGNEIISLRKNVKLKRLMISDSDISYLSNRELYILETSDVIIASNN